MALLPLVAAGLSGCADTARVYAMDDAALRSGTPKIEFTRSGLGHGPVTVTMPNGEVLHGEYQVTENAAVGFGLAGAHIATAVSYGSGRPVVISATGERGTILNCEGAADIDGHGSGICETNKGHRYRVMFWGHHSDCGRTPTLAYPYSYYRGNPLATVAIVSRHCQTSAVHGGWAVRLPIIALATALLVSILPAFTSAQTGNGVLDIWLKVRESADAPKVTLYTKSRALVIGMDHYDGRSWPQLSNSIRDAEE
jgi:hypothetical protein